MHNCEQRFILVGNALLTRKGQHKFGELQYLRLLPFLLKQQSC
jgi:hypothetical protein